MKWAGKTKAALLFCFGHQWKSSVVGPIKHLQADYSAVTMKTVLEGKKQT